MTQSAVPGPSAVPGAGRGPRLGLRSPAPGRGPGSRRVPGWWAVAGLEMPKLAGPAPRAGPPSAARVRAARGWQPEPVSAFGPRR